MRVPKCMNGSRIRQEFLAALAWLNLIDRGVRDGTDVENVEREDLDSCGFRFQGMANAAGEGRLSGSRFPEALLRGFLLYRVVH